jgi:hypothetical protein
VAAELARGGVGAERRADNKQHTKQAQRQQLCLDRVRTERAQRQRRDQKVERRVGADLARHKEDRACIVQAVQRLIGGMADQIFEEVLAHKRVDNLLLELGVNISGDRHTAKPCSQRGILKLRGLIGRLPGRHQPDIQQAVQQRQHCHTCRR